MRRPWFALGAFLALAACRTEPGVTALDLIEALPTAEPLVEVRSIVFGRDDARRHLQSGWWNAREHDGTDGYVWSSGPTSTLGFQLVARRELTLRLDGRPFNVADRGRQTVTVELNAQPVETITLKRKRDRYRVTIPAGATRVGDNQLTLRYGYALRPRDVGAGSDRRELGVAWYAVHVGDVDDPERAQPKADLDRALLFLPYGSAVRYTADLDPGTSLVVDAWTVRGEGGALEVVVQWEGEEEQIVATVNEATKPQGIPLGARGGLGRVTLRALPRPGVAHGDGGVGLVAPRLETPASEGPSTESETVIVEENREAPGHARPNVIVYLIDTLRADHLGCYGYDRPTSPHLDAFAAEAVLFEEAIAQSSWTKASVASILTGLWPRAHGANLRSDTLAPEAQTLAELLRDAGYATAGFVTNPNVTASFGFEQGYDHYDFMGEATDADEVTEAADDWLEGRDPTKPFLLYLHTIDPHGPYVPPRDFRERFAPDVPGPLARDPMATVDDMQAGRIPIDPVTLDHLLDLYDAEIAFNDHAFGQLIDVLRARGLYDDTVIVVVSDHGEEFAEHGNFQHGRALHPESIHVPLIVKLPGQTEGVRITERVQHIDILPTLLRVLDLEPPERAGRGRNLMPWIESGGAVADAGDAEIVSYLHLDGPARLSLYRDEWKLVQRIAADESLIWPRLYQRQHDPDEHTNVAGAHPVRAAYLAARMRARLFGVGPRLRGSEAEIDEELRRSLEALGYLE